MALVAGCVITGWLAFGATRGTETHLITGLGAREIEVIAGYGGPQSPLLNDAAVEQISQIEDVSNVFPSGLSGVDPPAQLSGDTVDPWWIMPLNPHDDRLRDSQGNSLPSLGPTDMIVSSEYQDLIGASVTVGITKAISHDVGTGEDMDFTVVGDYNPDSVQHEVPNAAFVSSETFKQIQLSALPPGSATYTSIFVYTADVTTVAKVQDRIESLGFGARSAIGSGVRLDQAKLGLTVISTLLIITVLVGAVFVGMMTSSSWLTSRREEIGLFRCLGWQRSHIVRLYMLESLAFAARSTVVGCLLGTVVVVTMAFNGGIVDSLLGIQLSVSSLWIYGWVPLVPMLLVPLSFLLGTARQAHRLLRVDTDTLLRDI